MCAPKPRCVVNIVCIVFIFFAYMASVFGIAWVVTDTPAAWGLFRWCVNSTQLQDVDNMTDFHNCSVLGLGQSPVYFEGARCLTFATIMLFVIYSITLCNSCCCSQDRDCTLRASLALVGSAAGTPLLFAAFYTIDDRWEFSDPSLGVGFWMNLVCSALALLHCALNFACHKDTRDCLFRSKDTPGQTLSRAPDQPDLHQHIPLVEMRHSRSTSKSLGDLMTFS